MAKFPYYKQHDAMQCGVACLQMICRYYGKAYPQDALSEMCSATTEGVSLLGISNTATELGLHTTCGKATIDMLQAAPLPCVLHWDQNHFVVLYAVKKDCFYVADPGRGRMKYNKGEFGSHWLSTQSKGDEKGIAMFVKPIFLTTQTLSVMFSLIGFVVFGLVLLNYSWIIFLVFLAGSLLYAIWIAVFLKRRKLLDYLYFEKQAINNNKTYQFITSMQEIKLQDCEQRRRWEWEDVQADMFDVNMKVLKLQQTQEAGSILINEVKNVIITVLAATAVINGQMTLGMMLAVQYIIGQLNAPVEQMMSFLYSLQDVKISLERINEIHEMKNEEGDRKALTAFRNTDRSIKLRNVDFKYDRHSPHKILDGIDLTIPGGKVTAIVGASGSGKTTLIKLLLGYYPVLSGEIRIGDTLLKDYSLKWWRRQCGVVMQDGYIFSEDIARNIAVDDAEIDINRMLQAVNIANIQDFIARLPLKYNTLIGQDGVGLSQGQKQRVLIARAVYKDPQYIFLDEATNALDANNERVIVERLNEFYKGRTVVVVAHRLSTVKNADQIVVVDKGCIVEVGTHPELVAKQGAYYHLVKNQLELGN